MDYGAYSYGAYQAIDEAQSALVSDAYRLVADVPTPPQVEIVYSAYSAHDAYGSEVANVSDVIGVDAAGDGAYGAYRYMHQLLSTLMGLSLVALSTK